MSRPCAATMTVSPAIGAVAQDRAVLRLDEELDADLAPELGDQRQPVDDEAALAVGLDDDLEFAAVGQEPDAGAVALRQPDLVEQPGRLRRVVGRVFACAAPARTAGSPP